MNKKKSKPEFQIKKPELVMVGTLVPASVRDALKMAGNKERRTVSSFVRVLIEESPDVQEALKQIDAA